MIQPSRERENLKIAGSSPLFATIFPPTMFTCWHTSLHVKIHNQNDRSVANQIIEYTGLRQDPSVYL